MVCSTGVGLQCQEGHTVGCAVLVLVCSFFLAGDENVDFQDNYPTFLGLYDKERVLLEYNGTPGALPEKPPSEGWFCQMKEAAC